MLYGREREFIDIIRHIKPADYHIETSENTINYEKALLNGTLVTNEVVPGDITTTKPLNTKYNLKYFFVCEASWSIERQELYYEQLYDEMKEEERVEKERKEEEANSDDAKRLKAWLLSENNHNKDSDVVEAVKGTKNPTIQAYEESESMKILKDQYKAYVRTFVRTIYLDTE